MKLVKCYVSAFGKLQDFGYEFNSGLNTIKQDNGWGKSTFATFIKCMFYGLNDSKRNVAENERLKYKPWNFNGKFGGYLVFSWGGKEYKLERFFGAKEAEDMVALYDGATGKLLSNDKDWGRRIFQIDEEGFLSTTYFSQKDFQAKSNASLTAKFNDVCEIQDSDQFNRALNKIEEKAKTYKYRGDKGLISDAKREIFAIDEDIARAEKSVSAMTALKLEIKALEDEVDVLEKAEKELSLRIEKASRLEVVSLKKENFERLQKERQVLKETLTSAEEVLNKNKVNPEEIKNLQEQNRQLFAVNGQIETVKKDLETLPLQTVIREDKKIPAKSITYAITVALFVLTFIARVSLGATGLIFGLYALCGVGVISSLVLTFVKIKPKQKEDFGLKELAEAKQQALTELTAIKLNIERNIDAYIEKFNLGQVLDRTTALENILKVWQIYCDVTSKLNAVDNELSKIDISAGDIEQTKVVEDINSLTAEKARLAKSVRDGYDLIARKRSSVRYHEDLASSFADLESRKAEFNEKIKEYEYNQNVLLLTAKFLKQADENLKTKYRSPLQNSLKKYFDFVNGGQKNVTIDIDFNVTVEENGEQKITDFYSKGYQNLFELCKRFALIDVLFTGEKPFIILDDPFYNLDDSKLLSSISLINKLSNEYQILYLICHDSRRA